MEDLLEWVMTEPTCRRVEIKFDSSHFVNHPILWHAKVYSIKPDGTPRAEPGEAYGYTPAYACKKALEQWRKNWQPII